MTSPRRCSLEENEEKQRALKQNEQEEGEEAVWVGGGWRRCTVSTVSASALKFSDYSPSCICLITHFHPRVRLCDDGDDGNDVTFAGEMGSLK